MIISVYGIARLEEQAPSLLGRRQWKVQGPAVAYRALFLTGEGPCNYNAHSSGSSSPHIQRISHPAQSPPRTVTRSPHDTLQGGNTQSAHQSRLCVGLRGVQNCTTIPIPAVAYPNPDEIRISFQSQLPPETRVIYGGFLLSLFSSPTIISPLVFAVTSQLESYLHSRVYDPSYTSPNGDPPAGHHLGCPFCHSSNKWHPLLHPGSLPL